MHKSDEFKQLVTKCSRLSLITDANR